jgi:hypothetical protein
MAAVASQAALGWPERSLLEPAPGLGVLHPPWIALLPACDLARLLLCTCKGLRARLSGGAPGAGSAETAVEALVLAHCRIGALSAAAVSRLHGRQWLDPGPEAPHDWGCACGCYNGVHSDAHPVGHPGGGGGGRLGCPCGGGVAARALRWLDRFQRVGFHEDFAAVELLPEVPPPEPAQLVRPLVAALVAHPLVAGAPALAASALDLHEDFLRSVGIHAPEATAALPQPSGARSPRWRRFGGMDGMPTECRGCEPADDAARLRVWYEDPADGQKKGCSAAALPGLLAAGGVSPATQIWCDGLDGWMPLREALVLDAVALPAGTLAVLQAALTGRAAAAKVADSAEPWCFSLRLGRHYVDTPRHFGRGVTCSMAHATPASFSCLMRLQLAAGGAAAAGAAVGYLVLSDGEPGGPRSTGRFGAEALFLYAALEPCGAARAVSGAVRARVRGCLALAGGLGRGPHGGQRALAQFYDPADGVEPVAGALALGRWFQLRVDFDWKRQVAHVSADPLCGGGWGSGSRWGSTAVSFRGDCTGLRQVSLLSLSDQGHATVSWTQLACW